MAKVTLSNNPKKAVKTLLGALQARAKDIIVSRFGLGAEGKKFTLEAVGQKYGVTRERVRQIENLALESIKKDKRYEEARPLMVELKKYMDEFGGVVHEQGFLEYLTKDKGVQNHVHFLLVLGDEFTKMKEDDDFHHRWTTDKTLADSVHKALQTLHTSLSTDDLITENEIITKFTSELKREVQKEIDQPTASKWLGLSKKIGKNMMGEWGISHSPNIKTRGMRDFAYLVLRHHGSPMHFSEVAKAIGNTFSRKAHVATCHNELIKDDRFVLVGRGLYALKKWGYSAGTVRDIINGILEKDGQLKKEEIMQKVLRERYVKSNTILVNLQNNKYFKKGPDGKYSIAKSVK